MKESTILNFIKKNEDGIQAIYGQMFEDIYEKFSERKFVIKNLIKSIFDAVCAIFFKIS